MANKETYQPEDIEVLLNERSFDELLAEEKAFVLQHLSDAAEYERMRRLLQQVRGERSDAAPMDPDPVIRERVTQVFRDNRQSTWRIWLNSVHAFLLPQQAGGYWRPALAFASLALLVTVGVVGYRNYTEERQNAMAELRREEAEEPLPKVGAEPRKPDSDTEAATRPEGAAAVEDAEVREEQAAPVAGMTETPALSDATAKLAPATRKDAAMNYDAEERMSMDEAEPVAEDAMEALGPVRENTVVTMDAKETRVAGVQLANAETVSRARKARTKYEDQEATAVGNSRSMAADPALMALLQPGW